MNEFSYLHKAGSAVKFRKEHVSRRFAHTSGLEATIPRWLDVWLEQPTQEREMIGRTGSNRVAFV